MKKFYLIFILSSLFLNSFAQQLQWGKSTYGHGFDQVTSIVTTPTGNCLLSGTFKDSIDVDPNAGSVLCIPDTTAHVCAFIAEYDSNSNFLWKLEMIGPNIFPGRAICDASGNIYFGGTYKDSIHFQNTSYTLYGNLTKDVFFCKDLSIWQFDMG